MKKEIFNEIEIPEGVEVSLAENILKVKGSEGELKREFAIGRLKFEIKEGKIIIGSKEARKTEKKMMNTIAAHVKNMLKGVQEKFEYTLKICFNHFPMTVEIQGNEATIKNFLGEKVARKCEILEGTEVKVDKDIITVSAIDKELAGQTAANFEKATRISSKDRRVFQDGIFITKKAGREM
jgi:large subunit ribosomal protein L6